MNKINKLFTTSCIYFYTHAAIAANTIKKPSFINDVDPDTLSDAGEELSGWIFAFMAIVIGLCCFIPAYYFFTGEKEKAIDISKNILIGACSFIIFGGVVFAVMDRLS